jgi:hypothetical protein
MQRLRLIRPPQAGHRCFELKLSPCIAEIMTSAATHAVMAVTGLRFLVGTASLGRWGSRTYLSNSFGDRSAIPRDFGSTCERNRPISLRMSPNP